MKSTFFFLLSLSLIIQAIANIKKIEEKLLQQKALRPSQNLNTQTFKRLLDPDNYFNRDQNGDNSDNYVPIMESVYYGSWQSIGDDYKSQFDFFSQSSGYSLFQASSALSDNEETDGLDDWIFFDFYNGQYKDQEWAQIYFKYDNLTDFHPDESIFISTFNNSNITFTLILSNGDDEINNRNCTGSYVLNFIDAKNNQPYNQSITNYQDIVAELQLSSQECGIDLQATVSVANSDTESKALYYSLMVTLICMVHLYATVQMIKNISLNEYDGARYSLITLSLFTIWDIFMCLFHLYEALMMQDFFHYFITPAFWYFILASIFETRLMLIVWKIRYYQSFQTINEVRRGITTFYLKFYGGMLGILFLAYTFIPAYWFLSLTAVFFVPQIIHTALRGQRYKFDGVYVFLLGFIRIATPLYVRGCPTSIFKYTPSNTFMYTYTGFVLFQIVFLFLQAKLSARFFIPSCFLPPKYNYFTKFSTDVDPDDDETCSICMEGLCEGDVVSSETRLLNTEPKFVTIMTTPCRHKFHPKCLTHWMEIKLECPFCRGPIPPVD